MNYYVDRIEDGFAVLDNDAGERLIACVSDLPSGIRDGSVLKRLADGSFAIDETAENERRRALADRLQRLKNRH